MTVTQTATAHEVCPYGQGGAADYPGPTIM